jgi:hygromycin-B 4-O-kinase
VKTQLPPRDIQALVERAIGAVSEFEPLPEGLESQTFGFRQGSARYVARVRRTAHGYHKDAFAWRAFSSAALPIPEIVSIETFGEVSVCVSRRATGVRLRDVAGDPGALAPMVLDVLGELGRTDTGATTGYGSFDASGVAPFRTWRDYLLAAAEPGFCDWSLVRERSDRQRIEAAILAVERLAPADPAARGLIHGDFGSANLISDGRAITAVIDWDRALIGDPVYDQANLFFWGETHLRPVVARLTAEHAADADWAHRLAGYQLRICHQELSETLAGVNPVDRQWLLARCAELVDQAGRLD